MSKTIRVKVSALNGIHIETDGYAGPGCVESAKRLLAGLGDEDPNSLSLKPEYQEQDASAFLFTDAGE